MARRIRKTLEGEGRTVAFPDDEVPTERARRELQDNYRSCRAVVLTLVEAGELWLAGQVAQVTKATAFRRDPLDFLLVVTEAALGGNGNGSRPRKSLEALLDDSPLDCPWQIASLEEVEAKGVEGLFQKPGADPRADS